MATTTRTATPDLFVAYHGHSVLYHNQGDGTFHDVTAEAGVRSEAARWDTGCTWFDYDLDGRLDLFEAQMALVAVEVAGRALSPSVPVEGGAVRQEHVHKAVAVEIEDTRDVDGGQPASTATSRKSTVIGDRLVSIVGTRRCERVGLAIPWKASMAAPTARARAIPMATRLRFVEGAPP